MFQGTKLNEEQNRDPWPFDPKSITAVFVTHAHLDHSGRIPKLVKDGFIGKIYSTAPTKDLAELVLLDSTGIFERDQKRHGGELLYEAKDLLKAMSMWQVLDYHQKFNINDLNITLKNSGHIMGSSMVEISYNNKKVVFTGDMGNSPSPLLKDMEEVKDADVIVMEALYGDRNFDDFSGTEIKKEKGVLLIPAFSIERTQKILYQLNDMVEKGKVGQIPVFLDSPLAIKVTQVYKKYSALYFNDNARAQMLKGDDLLNFPGLKMTTETKSSKDILKVPAPKIIIAGSGMSNGGRILHHERLYLPDPKTTLLILSYQAPGSLGRMLEEGARVVNIMGEEVAVNGKTLRIEGYSSHPDMDKLMNFVEGDLDKLKKVFVVQTEPKTALFFVQRLRDYLGVDAYAPKPGDSYEV
jgi:metallo-beta-lactamase family protein